jgi:ABC-type glycerol-3-phosphate transport system substrate-binding protein
VHPFYGLNQPLKRYLTLVYGITLGLALVLALLAIALGGKHPPVTADVQPPTPQSTIASTENYSPPNSLGKPTEIPAVPPTPNEVTPSALGVTSSDLHGVQVSLWHPWSGALASQLQSILDDYSRTNKWGTTVNVTGYEDFGRMDEAIETAVISGTLPDILIDYSYQAQHWDASGVVADLTPYVDDPVWGFTSAEQADFYPAFWVEDLVTDSSNDRTQRLGIPFYRSGYLMFYNQSWANELGFSKLPSTPAEFKQQACAAMQATAEQGGKTDPSQGGWLVTTQPGVAAAWIVANGGSITNPTGSDYSFNTPETQQAFEYVKDLVDSGCAWFDPGLDAKSSFAGRGALFIAGSLFDIPAQQEAFLEAENLDEWLVIPFPSSEQPVLDTYGPSLIITRSSSAQQLAAWMVIKWLVYPHNQIKWLEAIQTLPTRQSAASYLIETQQGDSPWTQALRLLPYAHSEPSAASWNMVRWSLSDAMAELVEPKFTADQIPALLEKLDSLAAEIASQVH